MQRYHQLSLECSKLTTCRYSTSFSMGIRLFQRKYRWPVYAIYAFVRFADEIVDSFHDYDRAQLLKDFEAASWQAIRQGISSNPILNSFQKTVNQYDIEHDHIRAFFDSMRMDINKTHYTSQELKTYIYGSAEVIGLMCLRVFYHRDNTSYQKLKAPACKLGEAFQKINFLRDIQADYHDKGRLYFPLTNITDFDVPAKQAIEREIQADFEAAYLGIQQLKPDVRLGILLAYRYYQKLLEKIAAQNPDQLLSKRFRINNLKKLYLLVVCYCQNKFS